MAKITYENKVALNVNSDIADVNKCNATDLNEIKEVVNTNDDNMGLLSNLTTPSKDNLVSAINSVVESGSNDNGSWIKYSDGTMICYGTGSVQLANGVGYELITFPASFVSASVNTDIVILGTVITLNGSSSLAVREMIINCRANSNSNFYAYIKHSESTSTSYLVGFNYMAIGRWK